MPRVAALVAAAGKGSRLGLDYPKTLFPVQGSPILLRILEVVAPYDICPTIVVSPTGRKLIEDCLNRAGRKSILVIQSEPLGMGDAVLKFCSSPAYQLAEHVLLIWGDVPFIQPETVENLINRHFNNSNDFTFVTRWVQAAYTIVVRDDLGRVVKLQETREMGLLQPTEGERDIGLFIFRKELIFSMLSLELTGRHGETTREHGFLYLVEHLVARGYRVEGLPIAQEIELISLNRMEDIEGV